MIPRKKNLLEAFQSARHEPGPEPEPAPSVEPPRERGISVLRRGLPELPRWLPWAVLVGLAFLFGVVIGRGSSDDEVEAAPAQEPSAEPGASTPPPVASPAPRASAPPASAPPARAAKPGGQARIQDSALFDPANLYTVVVATYDQQHDDLAWATVEHLRSQGLEPFPPVAWRDKILVLVGAAPRAAELEATASRLRGLARDGGKPYHDAYQARIDSLIER
jgi:hypothetical protein